jgi:hypothetical protein
LTKQVGKAIDNPGYFEKILAGSMEEEKSLNAILNNPNAAGMNEPSMRKYANDALAETRSRIKRMQTGDVPYDTLCNSRTRKSFDFSFHFIW